MNRYGYLQEVHVNFPTHVLTTFSICGIPRFFRISRQVVTVVLMHTHRQNRDTPRKTYDIQNENVEVTPNQNEKKISQIPCQHGTGNRSSHFTYHITISNTLKIFTLNPHGSQIVQSRDRWNATTKIQLAESYIQHIHSMEALSIRNIIKYNNCNYIIYKYKFIHNSNVQIHFRL